MLNDSLISVDITVRDTVVAQIALWETGGCPKWRRIAANIKAEVALSIPAMTELLIDFAGEMARNPASPGASWIAACRKHQFKGCPVPPPLPPRLGRASPISDYAKTISGSPSITLSPNDCEELIRKIILAGTAPNPRESRILQKALLGRYVIWAAYRSQDPTQNPFDHLPKTTEAVRTALGLGECSETETLVLVSYQSHSSSGPLKLFRPTITEAGDYSWYAPNPDVAATHGLTAPLPPNLSGFPAMPEVIHGEINGETLVFPLYLAV